MTDWVVDADVALKWHLVQADSEDARAFAASHADLHAPEFQYLEVTHVLAKHVRMRLLTAEGARNALAAHRDLIGFWHDHSTLMATALDISLSNAHPFYDCLYLALAARFGGRLVTADRKLAAKFARGEHSGRIVLLGEFAGR